MLIFIRSTNMGYGFLNCFSLNHTLCCVISQAPYIASKLNIIKSRIQPKSMKSLLKQARIRSMPKLKSFVKKMRKTQLWDIRQFNWEIRILQKGTPFHKEKQLHMCFVEPHIRTNLIWVSSVIHRPSKKNLRQRITLHRFQNRIPKNRKYAFNQYIYIHATKKIQASEFSPLWI